MGHRKCKGHRHSCAHLQHTYTLCLLVPCRCVWHIWDIGHIRDIGTHMHTYNTRTRLQTHLHARAHTHTLTHTHTHTQPHTHTHSFPKLKVLDRHVIEWEERQAATELFEGRKMSNLGFMKRTNSQESHTLNSFFFFQLGLYETYKFSEVACTVTSWVTNCFLMMMMPFCRNNKTIKKKSLYKSP